MNSPDKITEQDLHTFVDGELDVASRAEIVAWLTDHPEDAQNIAAWGEQPTQLQALFGDVLDEPIPPKMEAALSKRAPSENRHNWWRSAATMLLLIAGTGAGYGHIARYVRTWMRELGIKADEIDDLLVGNPRRILAFA